ncbi:hypothetical protein LJ707_13210 [Mucilaginibacter sp. UR6-1]|uniref:hypothetical protein n=1 Tax=Mucilaginibacter sp. UR6-1 TaxID=1435643 RepID=UPI001E29EC4F|nr:hypothetical protein [Mucilaginibacter sp. UR6-1]MCC8409890.1 hypothetical protein [Mucilaginibacter sp. UR6-1]
MEIIENQVSDSAENEKEPNVLIAKIYFTVLQIDVNKNYSKYVNLVTDHQIDFNFKNLEEGQEFFSAVTKESVITETVDLKALAGIANSILSQL